VVKQQGPFSQSIARVLAALFKALTYKCSLRRNGGMLEESNSILLNLREEIISIEEQLGEIKSRLDTIESTVDATAETTSSRPVLETVREEVW